MATNLERLVELQGVLTRLEEVRSNYESPPEPVATLRAENERLEQRIAELQGVTEEADSERRNAEGVGTDAQEKVKHYESQISQVTTQKEYGALLSEIDTANQSRADADETALAAIERADTARTEIEELKARQEEVAGDLGQGLEEWEAQRPELKAELEQLDGQADVLREQLTPQIASLFERLLVRIEGNPMSHVIKVERPKGAIWRCASCNYSVRPQVAMQVRTGAEIVQCDTCLRILFFEESFQPDEEAS